MENGKWKTREFLTSQLELDKPLFCDWCKKPLLGQAITAYKRVEVLELLRAGKFRWYDNKIKWTFNTTGPQKRRFRLFFHSGCYNYRRLIDNFSYSYDDSSETNFFDYFRPPLNHIPKRIVKRLYGND